MVKNTQKQIQVDLTKEFKALNKSISKEFFRKWVKILVNKEIRNPDFLGTSTGKDHDSEMETSGIEGLEDQPYGTNLESSSPSINGDKEQ